MKKNRFLTVLLAVSMLALGVVMVVDLLPLLRRVAASAGDETAVAQYVSSYGIKGVPILIGLQALQIIVAVIPSAAIQLLTGLCYGAWWGTLINLTGCVLGNIIVFVAVRELHAIVAPVLPQAAKGKSWINTERLMQLRRPEVAAFALFLIPGIPNGILPYLFAKTRISFKDYILSVFAGSVPSTFLCTFMGDRISAGSYTTAAVIGGIAAAIVICVALLHKRILARVDKASDAPGPGEQAAEASAEKGAGAGTDAPADKTK